MMVCYQVLLLCVAVSVCAHSGPSVHSETASQVKLSHAIIDEASTVDPFLMLSSTDLTKGNDAFRLALVSWVLNFFPFVPNKKIGLGRSREHMRRTSLNTCSQLGSATRFL